MKLLCNKGSLDLGFTFAALFQFGDTRTSAELFKSTHSFQLFRHRSFLLSLSPASLLQKCWFYTTWRWMIFKHFISKNHFYMTPLSLKGLTFGSPHRPRNLGWRARHILPHTNIWTHTHIVIYVCMSWLCNFLELYVWVKNKQLATNKQHLIKYS